MTIPGFLAPLVSKFLDILLPSEQTREIKQKNKLGRYLVRTSAIIDAYIHECRRLRSELSMITTTSDEQALSSIETRFSRLGDLTNEFAATIAEISYLKLFDSDLDAGLAYGAIAEFGVLLPDTYLSLIAQAWEIAQTKLVDRTARLVPAGVVAQKLTTEIDIMNPEQRNILDGYIVSTVSALEDTHQRLATFVEKNYKVWELFHARNEYDRQKPPA